MSPPTLGDSLSPEGLVDAAVILASLRQLGGSPGTFCDQKPGEAQR